MVDFEKLQQDNAIIGSCGADAAEEIKLSKEVAGQIAGAFTYWLSQNVQKNPVMLNICVGTDERSSSDELKEGFLEAISLWGATGHDAGVATLHAVSVCPSMPCFEIDGSVMIGAGDLPENQNGFRFFTAEEEADEEDVKEILRLASRYNFIGGTYEKNEINLMQMYRLYYKDRT